jgi:hypothetical protein
MTNPLVLAHQRPPAPRSANEPTPHGHPTTEIYQLPVEIG